MQIPKRPPHPKELIERLQPRRALELAISSKGPEAAGRYLHWDELLRRTPPEGLTREEWWFSLWSARWNRRAELPLRDKAGQPFFFVRSDGVLRQLHELDRELGLSVELHDPKLANSELRDRYVMRSLMEEAITSSQLEGASTTRAVAKEMLRTGRPPRTKDERMIANNFRAMEFVREHLETPLTLDFLLELHGVLVDGTLGGEEAGRLRRRDEEITVQDVGNGEILHLPPPANELPQRLAALCSFANGTVETAGAFIHPIIRAVTLHFMLGYEHPFVDGNGRTARALFYWSMLRQKYWLTEFLTISRVIQEAKSQYARAFLYTETDAGDVTYFLFHQFKVIRQALEQMHAYLRRKDAEVRGAEKLVRAELGLNYRQKALLAHAFRHPGARYTIEAHRRENAVVYQTARQDLLDLAAAGLLVKRRAGRAFVFDVPADLSRRLATHGRSSR